MFKKYINKTNIQKTLLFALCLVLLLGLASAADQHMLASKLIRLHVIANSDTPGDQALKLQVRDAVLEYCGEITASASLEDIRKTAETVVRNNGYDYTVSVMFGQENYNTRVYDEFSLPSGEYTSLRVVIGDGGGENWWCVLFPPLCFASAEELKVIAVSEGFTEDEVSLITGKDEGYIIRFKCVEIFNKIVEFFSKD